MNYGGRLQDVSDLVDPTIRIRPTLCGKGMVRDELKLDRELTKRIQVDRTPENGHAIESQNAVPGRGLCDQANELMGRINLKTATIDFVDEKVPGDQCARIRRRRLRVKAEPCAVLVRNSACAGPGRHQGRGVRQGRLGPSADGPLGRFDYTPAHHIAHRSPRETGLGKVRAEGGRIGGQPTIEGVSIEASHPRYTVLRPTAHTPVVSERACPSPSPMAWRTSMPEMCS